MRTHSRRSKRERGIALISIFGILSLIAIGTTAFVSSATQTIRIARSKELDVRLANACEAGIQDALLAMWKNFKVEQLFNTLDTDLYGASPSSPRATRGGRLNDFDAYSVGVIGYEEIDTYNRRVIVRAVAWTDRDEDGHLDSEEARKIVDVASQFTLSRSQVFDYTYFVNNYGWMTGFGPLDLIVNGDMRANGNFDFSGGTPTINGSVFASMNDKLSPPAAGYVNITPNQYTNSVYNAQYHTRKRMAYNESMHGAKGSEEYEKWRDFLYDYEGGVVNNRLAGAIIGDARGYRKYDGTLLDSTPTSEIVMPDLSDLTRYTALSTSYVDDRQTFDNGQVNPDYGQGAYVKVWNSSTNSYVRLDTNGVVSGSGVLIGSSSKPILIHGPVTFTQDCVIKGYVQGQGTIYTGRNVHVVGSIRYKNPPNFEGTDQQAIDDSNSSKDMLALAARGSVMIGDVSKFKFPYPLYYMTPPFTKGRYDESGNWIPPFNAVEVDSTGRKRYQSVYSDSYINSISESVDDIDAILYTNYLGGGRLGTGGTGVRFNGSIISKDEAMVIYSLPMEMNYDNRIRERKITKKPLIDLVLPRTPAILRQTWQDRGFFHGSNEY